MTPTVPAWVPFLLIGLVLIGYRQTLTRSLRPSVLVGMALGLFLLSLSGVLKAFGAAPAPLLAWGAAYTLCTWAASRRITASGRLVAQGGKVQVPGSWWPMALILGMFSVKFVLGYATAVQAPMLHSTLFAVLASALMGLFSGGFAARAVAVDRAARQTRPVSTALQGA